MPRQAESRIKDWLRKGFLSLFDPDASIAIPVEGGAGQTKGLPDRYFAAAGRSAWVEAKESHYAPDLRQRRMLGRLASAGDRVILLRGRVDNESILTHIVAPNQGCYDYLGHQDLTYDRVFLRPELQTMAFWDHILGGVA